MRVGIIALLQESNTFLPVRTERRHFEQDLLLVGEAVRAQFSGGHHEMSGFLAELSAADGPAEVVISCSVPVLSRMGLER